MRKITREDFIGFEETVTTLPIYEDEDGSLFGWGHIDKQEVIKALKDIWDYYGFTDGDSFDDVQESDISHTYAKPYPVDGFEEDEIAFVLCPWDDEGAFPVTYLQL